MDIHDRIEAVHAMRESQQQLQFLNETLEQKVSEQTAEIRHLASELTKVEQRERNRIAHILHDDLQQRLYAIKLRLAFLLDGRNVDPVIERNS
jgi:signal transduction histidine kinase